MIVQNDILLARVMMSMFVVILLEFLYNILFDDEQLGEKRPANVSSDAPRGRRFTSSTSTISMSPPVHLGPVKHDRYLQDFLVCSRHIPRHLRRPKAVIRLEKCADSVDKHVTESSSQMSSEEVIKRKRLSLLPKLPNCEPDGFTAQEMTRLFPGVNIVDIVRFLVARKGNLEHAAKMMRSALDWHSSNFPSKLVDIIPALKTGCFFSHGTALDGTPLLFMRGAFYSSKVASPLQFVLAAAYVIDTVLAQSDQISVTVLVHASGIPGAPNESADINFIKLFVQVLSDNYPERLKKLVIYPFPWFARAMWGVIKLFVDKRTQDKVVLITGTLTSLYYVAVIDTLHILTMCLDTTSRRSNNWISS
jgi:hypothetical protein